MTHPTKDHKPFAYDVLRTGALFLLIYGLGVLLQRAIGTVLDEKLDGIVLRSALLVLSVTGVFILLKKPIKLFHFGKPNTLDLWLTFFVFVLFGLNNYLFRHTQFGAEYQGSLLGLAFIRLTIGSIAEEFFYRGLLQPYLNERRPSKRFITHGNLWASVFMTVAHLGFFLVMEPLFAISSVVLVLLLSLVAGRLRDSSQGLMLPIAFHLAVNYLHLGIQSGWLVP